MAPYNRDASGRSTRRPSQDRAHSRQSNRYQSGQRRSGQRSRSQRDQHPQRGSSQRASDRRRRNDLSMPDTGYTLHSRRVSFNSRGSTFAERVASLDGRLLVLGAIVVLVVIVLVVGISSCVRGSQQDAQPVEEEIQEEKPRVASGLSDDLTSKFNAALDRNDQLAQIAQNADQYEDERLLELALNEPDAISFVAGYPTADKSTKPYDEKVTRGSVPQIFDWDTRWGYMTYGDGPLAVTGSAPTTLAMAYMGLTGQTDVTPATIAQSATSQATSTSKSVDSAESVMALAQGIGLTAEQYEVSTDNLSYGLSDTSVIAAQINADTFTSEQHWVLVVGANSDGSLTVFDPTSSSVSSHTWYAGTLASSSNAFVAISVDDEQLAAIQKGLNPSGSTSTSSSGTSNGASSATTGSPSEGSSSDADASDSEASPESDSSESSDTSDSSETAESSQSSSSSSDKYVGL